MKYATCVESRYFPERKASNPRHQIAFIDQAAIVGQDYTRSLSPEVELIVIQSERDGIEQITEILADKENIASLQIIGSANIYDANLQLGISQLNVHTLEAYIDDLQQWQNSLSKSSEIMIYGCLVEVESNFQIFIQRLSNITKTDIGAYVTFDDSVAVNDTNDLFDCNSLMVAWHSR